MSSTLIDDLEIDYGTSILESLVGERLMRDRQRVRLFDQTRKTAECYFRSDEQGKPYIQNFAEGKRYYPFTAYQQFYKMDYATAKEELCRQYGLGDDSSASTAWQTPPRKRTERPALVPEPPVDYLPVEVYQQSQDPVLFKRNGFYQYLCRTFDESTAIDQFTRYRVGTSRRWQFEGMLATCWPQFDIQGNLHQVKVIPYDPMTGSRAKAGQDAKEWNPGTRQYEPDAEEKVWFAGKAMGGGGKANLQQCYFGEHLLAAFPEKEIALVEGESTAVVCSARKPAYIWLATGGSTGGKWYDPKRFAVLKGRKVVLWPDSGKYENWYQKAESLQGIATTLRVSRYAEDNIPPGATNLDLRDLFAWPRYTPQGEKPIFGEKLALNPVDDYPPDWDTVDDATPPTLTASPNRDEFTRALGLPADQLPLYRLISTLPTDGR